MFASPPEQTIEWSSAGVEGALRFLRRLWAFCLGKRHTFTAYWQDPAYYRRGLVHIGGDAAQARREIHLVQQQANYDFSKLQYNTVVSATMKMLRVLERPMMIGSNQEHLEIAVQGEGMGMLLRTLYPVAPHITWNLWNELGYAGAMGDIIDAPWPEPDPAALQQDEIEMVVQVNGKLRGSIRVPKAATKEMIEQMALADPGVVRHSEGRPVKRVIVVPGKLVNVVV